MQYIYSVIKRISILSVLFVFFIHTFAQENTPAQDYAQQFFQARQQSSLKSASQAIQLKQVYQSSEKAKTPLYIFDKSDKGFAIVAQNQNSYNVVAYSDDNNFAADTIPPQLMALLNYYEDSLQFSQLKSAVKTVGTPVVAPLLDEHNIALNQYDHPEVGGSVTGCVATAIAQIMKFHAAENSTPINGSGTFCYNCEPYGELCADFENSDYTSDELLSYHVAIAMKMRFTPEASSPADYSGLSNIINNFNQFVKGSIEDDFFLKNQIQNRMPVYGAIYGTPVGHAVVVDGYDDRDYYHLNFGWGGYFNGYFYFGDGHRFAAGKNMFYSAFDDMFLITPTPPPTNESDSLALVAIHNALGGYEATYWDLTKPAWSWPGTVMMDGRVIRLNLSSRISPVNAQSIASEIGNLSELQILDIAGPLNGSIPSTIANLSQLQSLSIHNTQVYDAPNYYKGNFSSALPADIDKLAKLEFLDISNALEGELPAALGNIPNLQTIIIYQDTATFGKGKLTGTIPEELGNLSQLNYINISNHQLTGSIPATMTEMSELTVVDLSANQLSGNIPALAMPKLSILNLSDNQFSGLSDENWTCPELKDVNLSNNNISGDFPISINSLSSLEHLNVSYNQISSLPETISSLKALKKLVLADNQLTELPKTIGELSMLEEINVDNNQLKALPDGLALPVYLASLSAANNQIAYVPDNLGQVQSLQYILLGYNHIQSIPSDLGYCADLVTLELNDNQIDSIPASFENMQENTIVLLQNNQIQGAIPEALMKNTYHLRLDNNRFRYNDIPDSEELHHGLSEQKTVALENPKVKVQMGDTVKIDIRTMGNFTHPDNEYYWLYYPEFLPRTTKPDEFELLESNPVLEVVINEETINNTYYCKVFNPASPDYTFEYDGSMHEAPCLYHLDTDTLSFVIATDEEIIADEYPKDFVTSLANTSDHSISDGKVTLVPPLKIKRGTVLWEASEDGETWEEVGDQMSNQVLQSNIESVATDKLVLKPLADAYYRCGIVENDCETLYSEGILVKSPGNVIFDEVINVVEAPQTISVDSIEVVVPQYFYDEDFRLTITKLDNAPAPPDTVFAGSAYDIKVSFGDTFEQPLLIKLKNIDKSLINETNINQFDAVYFDDHAREWKLFEDADISLVDSSLVFVTHHLTKVQWWSYTDEYRMGFTDVYERNNIRVFYKDKDSNYLKLIYGREQTPQSWHVADVPLMVQDITEYLSEVMTKYKALGLSVPDEKFKVYVEDLGGDDGVVGVLGMIKGYLSLSTILSNPLELRQACAHEYMHYIQDNYISAHGGNLFWMEAHATLSDRIVWDDTVIPFCESEQFLEEGRTGKNYAFNSLANSWDHWDMSVLTNNIFGDRQYYYQAGTFLHYMRSYREGTAKLEPAALLKETPWLQSWRTYLASFVSSHLNSSLGDEYEEYVKYIFSGKNEFFTMIHKEGNPYTFIKSYGNRGKFTHPVTYRFKEGDEMTQTDEMNIKVPYLASKMVLLENANPDTMVMVKYTRKHDYDIDHKVYYGTYDVLNKELSYVDITDSTEFSFLLEARTRENAKTEFKNYSFLLLVNKEYIGTSSLIKDFNASFDLTAMPVLDFEKVCMLDLYKGDSPILHSFSDSNSEYISFGTPTASYLESATGWDIRTGETSISRKIINDHTYQIQSQFSLVMDEGKVDNMITMIDSTVYTQTFEYDVLNGTLKVTELEQKHRKLHDYYEYVDGSYGVELQKVFDGYTDKVETLTKTCWVKDFAKYEQSKTVTEGFETSYGENVKMFKTQNTSESQEVVIKIDAHYQGTSYDKNGGVNSSWSKDYMSTDFSNSNIELYFIIKLRAK